MMDLDWPYKTKGKHFILFVQHIPGSMSKISNKFTVTVSLWKTVYNSLFFIYFSKLCDPTCAHRVVAAVGPYMNVGLVFPTVSITCPFQYHLSHPIDPRYKLITMPKFEKFSKAILAILTFQ